MSNDLSIYELASFLEVLSEKECKPYCRAVQLLKEALSKDKVIDCKEGGEDGFVIRVKRDHDRPWIDKAEIDFGHNEWPLCGDGVICSVVFDCFRVTSLEIIGHWIS